MGTPAYVYSSQAILANYRAYDEAFGDLPHTVCYAVKANSSLAVLALLAKAGAGFDIVSGGELFRVLQAGGDPSKVVFSGVGKTAAEVEYALESGIHSFNCESEAELALIDAMAARRGVKAGFSIRVNPDVDAVHPSLHLHRPQPAQIRHRHRRSAPRSTNARAQFGNLSAEGVSCHIGSQILDTSPILEAVDKVLALAAPLRAAGPRRSATGSRRRPGRGLPRAGETRPPLPPSSQACARACARAALRVMVEPGRSIVGAAGVLLTRVLYRKRNGAKEFVVVDAAMNDLIRPSLYHAHHEIVPLRRNALPPRHRRRGGPHLRNRRFPGARPPHGQRHARRFPGRLHGRRLRLRASRRITTRARARAEVLVEGAAYRIIRQRETYDDLVRGETV